MTSDKYKLKCTAGHSVEVQPDDLADILESDQCEECRARIESMTPNLVRLDCPCGYSETFNIDDAKSLLQTGCPNANEDIEAPDNIPFHHLSVAGSNQATFHNHEWIARRTKHKQLMKKDMMDYWEYLVHFTNNEGFISIMESRVIKTDAVGYYYKTAPAEAQAVCLTEAPLEYADRFFPRYGPVGFVFKKADLQALGALPVAVFSKSLIEAQVRAGGFAKELKPFVQLLRTASTGGIGRRYDWISDREWRVPGPVDLRKTPPVGMVFQEPISPRPDDEQLWREKLAAVNAFGEIKLF